ncbi:MAG: hypothetical protein IJC02_04475 [Lachnospiraceae bacterium]|nr:hypothetical protein [Lachnospiraceae bacterium]MBQ6994781.1 hypothetical protein [Lachnospiraceae bacterium]
MDNFMDKLVQKFNAQEIIKANSQAEAAEMKKLQLQVAEYEKILQEMRKLNYKNSELSEKIDGLVGENANKIQGLQEEETRLLSVLRNLTDEQKRIREEELARKEAERTEETKRVEEQKQQLVELEECFKQSNDFVHKENVKVYRNVQAVVVDELKNQTEALLNENQKLSKKINVVLVFGVMAFVFSMAGIVLQILSGLNILPF